MIELSKDNPPQHFNLTPQELLQRIATIPNLKFGWGELILLKGLLDPNVKGAMELQVKDGIIRVTLYQPNEDDIKFFSNKTPL
jgi:hypothetical protein